MKTFITILLLLLIVAETFSDQAIRGLYALNKSYIAEKVCVLRDVKGNDCKGKCFLAKNLAKAKDKKTPSMRTAHYAGVVHFFTHTLIFHFCKSSPGKLHFNTVAVFAKQEYIISFFHPPSALSFI